MDKKYFITSEELNKRIDKIIKDNPVRCFKCGSKIKVEGRTTKYYYCKKCKKAVDTRAIKAQNKGGWNG